MRRLDVERFGPPLVMILIVVCLAWLFVVPRFRTLGRDGELFSLRVDVDSPTAGTEIDDRLSGDLVVSELLQNAAMCHNVPEARADRSLDDWIVVSSKPEFVRAAELGVAGDFAWNLIDTAEQHIWNGDGGQLVVAEMADDGFEQGRVEAYLKARVTPPSHEAQLRYVAYAVRNNVFYDDLRVIDTTTLDAGAIRAFADDIADPKVHLAGTGGAQRPFAASMCHSVLDELRQVA